MKHEKEKNKGNRAKTAIALSLLGVIFAIITFLAIIDFPYDYHPKDQALIHLYGEGHGVKEYYEEELRAWGEYYQEGHRALFVELPYYTAEYLNIWMRSDDDTILDEIYTDIEGTLSHVPAFLDFYHAMKTKYPETVFYGTDVGHQYFSTGERYLAYLEAAGKKDTETYDLALACVEQGKKYRGMEAKDSYRENCMVENFIAAYDRCAEKEIMGIYGSYHTDPTYGNRMAGMLKAHYGDIVEGNYVINRICNSRKPFTLGFGYTGLIFLLMLFVPNLIWTKFQPEGYADYAKKENRVLVILEKFGQVAMTCSVLIFADVNPAIYVMDGAVVFPMRTLYLILALGLMILYEIYWIRYFRSPRSMQDFYRGILGIPLAGATLPVAAVFLIGVYGHNPVIVGISIVLGVGHIGIHMQHAHEVSENTEQKG